MIVFRLCKSEFAKDLSGKGAERSGGRWNSKGVAMVYTGASRALCTTEIAVHTPLGILPTDYSIVTIELAEDSVLMVDIKNLPIGWNVFPYPHATQLIGDQFIKDNKFLALQVPSAMVQGEYNYLLYPRHENFSRVKIKSVEPFTFDGRLFLK